MTRKTWRNAAIWEIWMGNPSVAQHTSWAACTRRTLTQLHYLLHFSSSLCSWQLWLFAFILKVYMKDDCIVFSNIVSSAKRETKWNCTHERVWKNWNNKHSVAWRAEKKTAKPIQSREWLQSESRVAVDCWCWVALLSFYSMNSSLDSFNNWFFNNHFPNVSHFPFSSSCALFTPNPVKTCADQG